MQDFIPGQRWISDAELQMGLGTVLSVEHRTVTVLFMATGETRTYAKATAPLTRVAFAPGDTIHDHQGNAIKVVQVAEEENLLFYQGVSADGTEVVIPEGQLDNFMQLNRPTERLFSAQIDADKWFELRYQTLQHLNRLAHFSLRGLTGARTSLIPHQLYIAHEVANRYAPRVLLADEVGLGKTIEAGLILHQQLLTERAKRVLIVVPDTLVHQWLVEMLRRFNLYFSIFDEERCRALEAVPNEDDVPAPVTTQDNPFHTEQLVLCSLSFLRDHPNRFNQALAGEWDLMVVDEAHHLQWSPQAPSLEYQLIEQLANRTKGVLLLTATPEQLGKASHFARLRLLDADRFPDLEQFIEEEKHYEPIAEAIEILLSDQVIDEETIEVLRGTISEGDNQALIDELKNNNATVNTHGRLQLVEHLLDRHGTGRVLYRNTRNAVKGFPERQVHAYALPLPEPYAACFTDLQSTSVPEPQSLLCPEILYQTANESAGSDWTQFDPRLNWLAEKLQALKPAKVLVITANASTALEIAQHLKTRSGITASVFHEGLSIVERDRMVAYFADMETGSQVLVCSEIGSEGRNFQFAHHLILFDLPLNPDLLEQRIGRLDRIGQTETIQIHVPYIENSAQAIMYRWYHEGLSAFEHTCPAGHNVFVQVEDVLIEALHQLDEGLADLDTLIKSTQNQHQQLNDALHRGRDRLLEYNSCRPSVAKQLQTVAMQQDDNDDLLDYMDNIFDCYGLDNEWHSQDCYIIRPSDHMQSSFYPLPEDGMTITYNRQTALANENMHFMSWEHPMVNSAMDAVVSNELGNTAVCAVNYKRVKPGTVLLECLYSLESANIESLQSSRYLPPTTIRVVVDEKGNNHADDLKHETISATLTRVDTDTAKQIIKVKQDDIRVLVAKSEKLAEAQAPEILNTALQQTEQTLLTEINRLKALQQVNPNVRAEEIQFFEQQWEMVNDVLKSARLRLDALRVIVAT